MARTMRNSTTEQHLADKAETVKFFQTMVGVIDVLMQRGLVPREDFGHWHGRRGQFTHFIGRSKDSIERQRVRHGFGVGGQHGVGGGKAEGDGARKRGLKMSPADWELRRLRYGDKAKEKSERNRVKAVGLRRWDVGQARGRGFADSPMELGEG